MAPKRTAAQAFPADEDASAGQASRNIRTGARLHHWRASHPIGAPGGSVRRIGGPRPIKPEQLPWHVYEQLNIGCGGGSGDLDEYGGALQLGGEKDLEGVPMNRRVGGGSESGGAYE